MPRIFVCTDTGLSGTLDPAAERLREQGHEVIRGPTEGPPGSMRQYDAQERQRYFGDTDVAVFTNRHACTAELMGGAPRLRGVCSPFIGVESIDIEAALKLGLPVGHGAVRGNVVGMAEATVMLMLMLFYDVQTNIRRLQAGQWRRTGNSAHQLTGKTVGLVGFGRIAREVAFRLLSFGVRIVTHSPRARPEDLPVGVEKVDLKTLLRISDLVTVLTGLTAQTRHLIDAEAFASMKPTAFLVNTDRGGIVDEAALIDALRQRRIAGAALDAFAVEPLAADSPLRGLDNVILTPHCVGHTKEAADEFVPALLENVESLLQGRLPPICKNPNVERAWRQRLCRIESSLP